MTFGRQAMALEEPRITATPASAPSASWGQPTPRAAQDARVRALVTEQFDFIWRALCHLGVPEADVDDAAQQVFLIAAQKLGAIQAGSERAFLYSTALRIASRARRTQQRRREVDDGGLAGQADGSANPEEILERQRSLAALDEVLDGMPIDSRAVFTLYEIEEVSVPGIAELLGIPVGTVASRLRKARKEFHERARRAEARRSARAGGQRS